MTEFEMLYPVCVLLAGYLVLGITGFGSALVAVPLLALVWPLHEVVVLAILLDIPASILHCGLNLRQVRWQALMNMLPGMVVGSGIGLLMLGQLDKRWPLFALGVYIMWVGLQLLRQVKTPSAIKASELSYHLGSGLVGLVEVMFATAGPVVLAVLQRKLNEVAEIRATVPIVMVVAGSVAVAVLLSSGQVDGSDIGQRWLFGLPVAVVGVLVGNRLAKRIAPSTMRRTVAVLLTMSGLSLIRNLWL